jgi:hypothetical protein
MFKSFLRKRHLIETISNERDSGDGIWVYLKPGWIADEVHHVHEDTVRECLEALKEVRRCNCEECQSLLATFYCARCDEQKPASEIARWNEEIMCTDCYGDLCAMIEDSGR